MAQSLPSARRRVLTPIPGFTFSLFHYFTISLFYFQKLADNYVVNIDITSTE